MLNLFVHASQHHQRLFTYLTVCLLPPSIAHPQHNLRYRAYTFHLIPIAARAMTSEGFRQCIIGPGIPLLGGTAGAIGVHLLQENILKCIPSYSCVGISFERTIRNEARVSGGITNDWNSEILFSW